jgi:integrase
MSRDHPIERGIVRTPYGFRVYVRVHGQLLTKRFPVSATLPILRAWRDETIRSHRLTGSKAARGTLAGDVAIYLRAVASMPTYADRKRDLERWLDRFGHRARWTLTPVEIRTQLEEWRASGKAASTCNHRRTALSHLFSTLDRGGPNPVRAVTKFKDPKPTPRGIPPFTVRRILRKMAASRTKARLEVLAWTGMRPKELMHLAPADVNRQLKQILIRTAKDGPPRIVPLTPLAVAALQRFAARDAWGPFSLASARKSLHLACKAAKVPPIRIYDLRHSFLSLVAVVSRDERIVQHLAGHTHTKTTQRYTLSSVDPRIMKAMAAVGRALASRH